jgi:hypothetical protein
MAQKKKEPVIKVKKVIKKKRKRLDMETRIDIMEEKEFRRKNSSNYNTKTQLSHFNKKEQPNGMMNGNFKFNREYLQEDSYFNMYDKYNGAD